MQNEPRNSRLTKETMSGLVPSDAATSNVTTTQIAASQTTVARVVRTQTLQTQFASIGQLETVPVTLRVDTDNTFQFVLANDISVYTPATRTVQLQATINPLQPENLHIGYHRIAFVPPEFAPPISQYLDARIPLENSPAPTPFDTILSLWLKPTGEIIALFNGFVGYCTVPIQFSYRLAR